jgi:hypothetical protein
MEGIRLSNIHPRLRAALAVVVGLALVQTVLVPVIRWHREKTARVLALRDAVERKKALAGREAELRNRLDEAASALQALQAEFAPGPADPRQLQLQLQKRVEALAAGMGIRTVNVDWLYPGGGDLPSAPVKFRLEATPEQLLSLVHALESGRPFHTIDALRITARPTSEYLQVEMDITAYGLPAGEEVRP